MEIWKDIKGYEGLYQVSNTGKVKFFRGKKEHITTGSINCQGYRVTSLTKDKVRITKKIHRLVAETFIPIVENKPYVNHIDGNKLNNLYSNLEWVTSDENTKHAAKIGLLKRGETVGISKLTESQVKEILQTEGVTISELGKKYGVAHQTISWIRRRKGWKHLDN